MKKFLLIVLSLSVFLCGCSIKQASGTYFYFDTAVSVSAECSDEILNGAFALCKYYDDLFNPSKEQSDIYKINSSLGKSVTVNNETVFLLNKALYYYEASGKRYDITMASVSCLYDFYQKTLPNEKDINDALLKVGMQNLIINGNKVTLKKGRIDLGSIAKGYIADKLCEYFKENGVKNAVINLGGNVYTLGKQNQTVGIKKPFEDDIVLYAHIKDTSFVTSGIDQRFIEKDGIYYHHVLDKATGYGVQNSLASVTVIGKSSTDADAISTVCMLLGLEDGLNFIEKSDFQAIFIEKDGTITLSSGLEKKNNNIYLR